MAVQPTYRNRFSRRSAITREMHGLALVVADGVSQNVPAEHRNWAYDLRRGRMNVYGSLLRCIDLLHARGFSKEVAMRIPKWITAYIEDLWLDTPEQRAEALPFKKVA